MTIASIISHSTVFSSSSLGFTVGAIFSSIMLALVIGAYLAVIVLFAENPEALEENHQELYQDLREAYKKLIPDIVIGSPYDSSVV